MKIILSRKGFDSTSGRFASPILPDGRMISLPIPDSKSHIEYSDLKLDNKTYFDIINDLRGKKKVIVKCHLDPDLYPDVIKRMKGWKPVFGQSGAAQKHLENQGVGAGDLFFGWFRRTVYKDEKLVFDKKDIEGRHIIYGYL